MKANWQSCMAFTDQGVCNGANALLYALGRMLMRHTNAQTTGGQAVSQLPPKTEESLAGGHAASLHTPSPLGITLVRKRHLDPCDCAKAQPHCKIREQPVTGFICPGVSWESTP